MRPILAEAISQSGALDPEQLAEFIRWRLPVDVPEIPLGRSSEEVIQAFQQALEDDDSLKTRFTDLDILKQYLDTQKKGRLHLIPSGSVTQIVFGLSALGEYIIPWKDDTIEDVMTNGESFLSHDGKKVFFRLVRELFFDDRKVFMLCEPWKDGEDAR